MDLLDYWSFRFQKRRLINLERDLVDCKTSMITDEDPPRGLLFYSDLGFSHTLHVLTERRRRCEHPHLLGLDQLMVKIHFDHFDLVECWIAELLEFQVLTKRQKWPELEPLFMNSYWSVAN